MGRVQCRQETSRRRWNANGSQARKPLGQVSTPNQHHGRAVTKLLNGSMTKAWVAVVARAQDGNCARAMN